MSIYKPAAGKPELSVIDGGGDPAAKAENFLQYARRMVAEAFGEKPEQPDAPYGHLSSVPPLPEDPVVRSITEAPSYRPAQFTVEGTGALAPSPAHTSAEGEVMSAASKMQRRMEHEAREDAVIAHIMGPEPPNPENFL